MNENRLKMNAAKTEFMLFGRLRNLSKIDKHHEIDVVGEAVKPSDTLQYLGSFLDPVLLFKEFIKRKCTIANWNLLKIKHIRNYLTVDVAKTIVDALVTSHLDYANGLLIGISNTELKKLQRIQNKAAKIVLKRKKFDSASDCLRELHWLPIKARVEFKVVLMVYKCLNNEAPIYIKELLKMARNRNTHSSDNFCELEIPRVSKKTFATCSFAYMGP